MVRQQVLLKRLNIGAAVPYTWGSLTFLPFEMCFNLWWYQSKIDLELVGPFLAAPLCPQPPIITDQTYIKRRGKYLELYQRSNCRLKIVSFSQPQKKSWHYCFILKFKIYLARHRNGLVSIRMWLVDVWPCAFCSKAVVATSIQLWRRVTNNLSTFYTFTLTRTRTWGRKLKSFDNIFILYHLPD